VIRGSSFNGLDDAVRGATGYDAQAVADGVSRLMVGGVHRDYDFTGPSA